MKFMMNEWHIVTMEMCDMLLQDCFLTMSPAWYQSLIKVLLNRFPQSCRHFDDNGIQYLVRGCSLFPLSFYRRGTGIVGFGNNRKM